MSERTDYIRMSVILSTDLYKSKLVVLFLFKIRVRFDYVFETKSTDLLEIIVQEARKFMYLLNFVEFAICKKPNKTFKCAAPGAYACEFRERVSAIRQRQSRELKK